MYRQFGADIARHGYQFAYRPAETNHCPGCGRSHWFVGRMAAECAFCGTALPLSVSGGHGVGLIRTARGRPEPLLAAC